MKKYFEQLPIDWKGALGHECSKPYVSALDSFLQAEQKIDQNIFPPEHDIFNAFSLTSLKNVSVVILGQDPYHGAGQAHGLAFSVRSGIKLPPSLVNIYKEIEREYSTKMPRDGDLSAWAQQGVLLLNATLTVREGQAGSHQKKGWEEFTDAAIRVVNTECEYVVFMLWGSYAQKKQEFIDQRKHLILTAPHPSPLSAHRGFLGCDHFTKANAYLQENGRKPINWVK